MVSKHYKSRPIYLGQRYFEDKSLPHLLNPIRPLHTYLIFEFGLQNMDVSDKQHRHLT